MSKIHTYSWQKSASLIRDEKNIKFPEKQYNLPSNKNTKKWCKGKVGVEHFYKIFSGKYAVVQTLNCINCGKCIDIHYSFDKTVPFWSKDELLARCFLFIFQRVLNFT